MNRITIVGKIKNIPQLKKADSGDKYVQFTISCHSNVMKASGELKEKTDIFNCVAWHGVAEQLYKVAYTDMKIALHGVVTTTYYFQNGFKTSAWQVKVDDFEAIDKPKYRNENNVKDIDELAESDDIF